jgi:hypothetical protein
MSIDFQQVQSQIKRLGEAAYLREQRLQVKREKARALLESWATDFDRLSWKVLQAQVHDQTLRCALPVKEPMDASFDHPGLPLGATLIAADGSQIAPDRHAEVLYCLVNVGGIFLQTGSSLAPSLCVETQLYYDDQLLSGGGVMTEAALALNRDLAERSLLARLARESTPPVITFTDGPMELWGARDGDNAQDFQQKLEVYLHVLKEMAAAGAVTGGYVDKPSANLVLRLLEVAILPEDELPQVKKWRPLQGVSDIDLFRPLLGPGQRSGVFSIQSKSANQYQDELALHFFYLNVGLDRPWLARVEIPGWVAQDDEKVGQLHAALVEQCRILGRRSYPYLLHRAHEAAVVTLQEKEQVTQMIVREMRNRGLSVGEISHKQGMKNLPRKGRYKA